VTLELYANPNGDDNRSEQLNFSPVSLFIEIIGGKRIRRRRIGLCRNES